MPKVFVIGALTPRGGGHMAYHLGRLLHRHFGYEFISVLHETEKDVFKQDIPVESVTVSTMERTSTRNDIVVINPSYSYMLTGMRVAGRKIMYIQDFRTFDLLDCHCDLYISVSSVVSRTIYALYGISTMVIPPFITLDHLPETRPWHERPPGSALVYMKNATDIHKTLLREITARLQRMAPHIDISQIIEPRGLAHQDFLRPVGEVRYFINMSLAEGFGLVPLEAMAMGAMVTGVDGLGGRDYMRHGQNCLVGSIKNLRILPDIIHQAFTDENLAKQCAANGMQTAKLYAYEPFKMAWLRQMSALLQTDPINV